MPAAALPVALVVLGFFGMTWGDVDVAERMSPIKSFLRLLVIPLLLIQFAACHTGRACISHLPAACCSWCLCVRHLAGHIAAAQLVSRRAGEGLHRSEQRGPALRRSARASFDQRVAARAAEPGAGTGGIRAGLSHRRKSIHLITAVPVLGHGTGSVKDLFRKLASEGDGASPQ